MSLESIEYHTVCENVLITDNGKYLSTFLKLETKCLQDACLGIRLWCPCPILWWIMCLQRNHLCPGVQFVEAGHLCTWCLNCGTSPVGRFSRKLGPAGSYPIFIRTLQVEPSHTFLLRARRHLPLPALGHPDSNSSSHSSEHSTQIHPGMCRCSTGDFGDWTHDSNILRPKVRSWRKRP